MPDLLVRDAERLVTMTGDEIVGGWAAVTEGRVERWTRPGLGRSVGRSSRTR
jgi:hypothetical protein